MQRTAPEVTAIARRLRREATPAERRLWHALRTVRPRFTRQLAVGNAVIDIACRSLRIAVELDGGHHALQVEDDLVRTRMLEERGWTVLRFWNGDVMTNTEGVVEAILAAVSRGSTHPRPLPEREGSG
jgi:very-short-patch-repair endonuclease